MDGNGWRAVPLHRDVPSAPDGRRSDSKVTTQSVPTFHRSSSPSSDRSLFGPPSSTGTGRPRGPSSRRSHGPRVRLRTRPRWRGGTVLDVPWSCRYRRQKWDGDEDRGPGRRQTFSSLGMSPPLRGASTTATPLRPLGQGFEYKVGVLTHE